MLLPVPTSAAPLASASGALSASQQLPSGGDNVFKTLAQKLKALEVNQSLFDRYMSDVSQQTVATLRALEADVAALEAAAQNASAALGALGARLALAEARAAGAAEAAAVDAEAATAAAAAAMRARLEAMAAAAAREALAPLAADVAALQDAARASAARDLAFAAVTAMLLAAMLLAAAREPPLEEAPVDAPETLQRGAAVAHAAPASADASPRHAQSDLPALRPRRVVLTLRGACAALALANGALGLLLHVSAARPPASMR